MSLNRKSLLQIIYLISFWIQPVNAIRIMPVFTLLVQNYGICKIILFIQNIYQISMPRYLRFRIFRNISQVYSLEPAVPKTLYSCLNSAYWCCLICVPLQIFVVWFFISEFHYYLRMSLFENTPCMHTV